MREGKGSKYFAVVAVAFGITLLALVALILLLFHQWSGID
jgi:hypothetical protein